MKNFYLISQNSGKEVKRHQFNSAQEAEKYFQNLGYDLEDSYSVVDQKEMDAINTNHAKSYRVQAGLPVGRDFADDFDFCI